MFTWIRKIGRPNPIHFPAGTELNPNVLSARTRFRARRRLQFLNAKRHVVQAELGGIVYEIDRYGNGLTRIDQYQTITGPKLRELEQLSNEIQELEIALRQEQIPPAVAYFGGLCVLCDEPYSTHARFCSNCGHGLNTKQSFQQDKLIATSMNPKSSE